MLVHFTIGVVAFLSLLLGPKSGWSQIKPGDKINAQSWEKVKDIVPQNLLKRIKAGYVMEIAEPSHYKTIKEFTDATEKYSGQAKISPDGNALVG